LALLSLGLSSLRVSQFKLPEIGKEDEVLASWLQPTVAILQLSFR
jgi:hypothetical protein